MKLESPLTELQRQRLETALDTLQRTHAGFETKLRDFGQTTAQRGVLEFSLAATRRSARILPSAAAKLPGIVEEIALAQEKCEAAHDEANAARLRAVNAIQDAGYLIQRVCAPLLGQFKNGLAHALRAFCLNPAGTVEAIPDHGTEFPVLVRFLQRGQHVARTAGPEEIESLTFELSRTLRCVLDGGDIWKLRGEITLQDTVSQPG